jgi:hypothetical protein
VESSFANRPQLSRFWSYCYPEEEHSSCSRYGMLYWFFVTISSHGVMEKVHKVIDSKFDVPSSELCVTVERSVLNKIWRRTYSSKQCEFLYLNINTYPNYVNILNWIKKFPSDVKTQATYFPETLVAIVKQHVSFHKIRILNATSTSS